ncbi:MAG: hypothetical protein R3C46_12895 [Hyphomonadaceae bacterium]
MKAWICAVALSVGVAAPAFAQKTDLPDRPAKRISEYDPTAIREANTTLRLDGMCTADFTVSAAGELADLSIDCTHPEMAPYIEATMRSAKWQPEILEGEFFDSLPMRERFKYGTSAAPTVDPRGEKSPVLQDGIVPRDITKAIAEVNQEGACKVKFTVGVDGKPKDIQPNCDPAAYDPLITAAVERMKYTPGEKDGQPTDWPNLSLPINLTKPKGT